MSDCVISNYCKTVDGYARLSINGVMQYHHRIAYIQHHGLTLEDIKGKVVMHSCDNPPCINPAHLKLGTQADNMSDMIVKCRHAVDYNTTNKIGFKGVCNAGIGKFGAQIFVNGSSLWLGTFDSPEEANAAYIIAFEKKKQSIEARQRKSTGTCVGKSVEWISVNSANASLDSICNTGTLEVENPVQVCQRRAKPKHKLVQFMSYQCDDSWEGVKTIYGMPKDWFGENYPLSEEHMDVLLYRWMWC